MSALGDRNRPSRVLVTGLGTFWGGRVAQAQELLPYLKGDIELEPAVLDLDPPDGLLDAVSAQTRRLLQPTTGPSSL